MHTAGKVEFTGNVKEPSLPRVTRAGFPLGTNGADHQYLAKQSTCRWGVINLYRSRQRHGHEFYSTATASDESILASTPCDQRIEQPLTAL